MSGLYTGSLGAVSNAEDWIADFGLINEDNTPFSALGSRITLAVCREGNSSAAIISATTDDGSITISDDGSTFSWVIPTSKMQQLCPDVYNTFLRATINGSQKQLISGTVTIVDGGPAL